jgi:hypothetical protein
MAANAARTAPRRKNALPSSHVDLESPNPDMPIIAPRTVQPALKNSVLSEIAVAWTGHLIG